MICIQQAHMHEQTQREAYRHQNKWIKQIANSFPLRCCNLWDCNKFCFSWKLNTWIMFTITFFYIHSQFNHQKCMTLFIMTSSCGAWCLVLSQQPAFFNILNGWRQSPLTSNMKFCCIVIVVSLFWFWWHAVMYGYWLSFI